MIPLPNSHPTQAHLAHSYLPWWAHLLLTALVLPPLFAADTPPKEQKPAPEFRKYELPVEPD